MDERFKVKVLSSTPNPQQLVWLAMHQDYCEGYVGDRVDKAPVEEKAGELIVKTLLQGNRGHFGCLEYPQITFATGYFPHSVMQQARTHRVGITFDVQSMRYTGQRIIDAYDKQLDIEEMFYLRPIGQYTDRQGKRYEYTEQSRNQDLQYLQIALVHYAKKMREGFSEEHARGTLPFDFRQHFVVGFNARSLMHFLDLRAKKDAQLEIQWLCELMFPHFQTWMPQVASWYEKNRYGKALLAP